MSGHPKQPKPNWLKDGLRKISQKLSPAPSRSTTPALSIREESSPGATAISPRNSESAPRSVSNGADSLKGGDVAKTDKWDAVQSMRVGETYTLPVSGGVGGRGGQDGVGGGPGGVGEGPKITFPYSSVNLINPNDTKLHFIKEKLAGHVAAQYRFTDQSKSLCAPGTRVEIQADILQWLSPQHGPNELIFWITGIAGSGKSTLSATVVDILRNKHTPVAAQFFISRNIPETIDPAKIIPTIAQQLAEFSPTAAHIIHDTLTNGFPPTQKEQVKALLLAPIQELSRSHDVVVIVIDALDELRDAAKSVLGILSEIAPRDCAFPDNVRFIITSRPEHWADISRSKTLELAVFKQHALETESSVCEVHNFIVTRMMEITPGDWDDWPTREQVAELSEKANGLFHYAATALQWIEKQIHEHNRASRKWVFDEVTQMGIVQLEYLYRHILTSFVDIGYRAQNADIHANQLRGFRHVIGTIVVLYEPLTIRQITALLADIPEDDFDVAMFLQRFRSVLIQSTTAAFEEATPWMHKSFLDYITNNHAPTEFRILIGDAHFLTARSCLEVIVKRRNQSDIDCKYSGQYWHQHLRQAVEEDATCEDERMWNLLGQMVEEAVVDIWAVNSMDIFTDVAAAGWGLLKRNTEKHRIEIISSILTKAKLLGQMPLWEEEQIPYQSIWDHGLLETWKHSEDIRSGSTLFTPDSSARDNDVRDANVREIMERLDKLFRHDKQWYTQFLASRGVDAQWLLDLLQDLLDYDSNLAPMDRHRLFKALIRLSGSSKLYPRCFSLPDVACETLVAGGGFGDVYTGLLCGQRVAVKMMRAFETSDMEELLKGFGREALIWRQLSHPNLLPFYGLYSSHNRLCLVSPWMENGHIGAFLKKETTYDTESLFSFILDVALGLEYLHSKGIVHGDLKGANILVTPSGRACIADFGLSSLISSMSSIQFTNPSKRIKGGTLRYQAPELHGGQDNDQRSDIYGFASLAYEILTRTAPFSELRNEAAVIMAVSKGNRPSRQPSCSGTPALDDLWNLFQACWDERPENRPTAPQIVERLMGREIQATTAQSASDWDDTSTSRFRHQFLGQQPFPSVMELERVFGAAVGVNDAPADVDGVPIGTLSTGVLLTIPAQDT